MKRLAICIALCLVCFCGCAKNQYTYADIPENAGFEMKHINGELVYIDYDLLFKISLPNNDDFIYDFEYETPDLSEGAPIGRSTLTLYYREKSEPLSRNVIEIKSTLVGTREGETFAQADSVNIPNSDKTYRVAKNDNGVLVLYENFGEMYCIKADLSQTAYRDLRETLEAMMCSIEELLVEDPYFQEFAEKSDRAAS